MRIGELARQSGVAASTLRFYESSGLLPPTRRAGNGYRDYPSASLERIGMIRMAQGLGFNLEQIARVLSDQGEGLSHPLIVQGLQARLVEIEQMQTRLHEQRQGVERMLLELQQSWSNGRCLSVAERLPE
jgi:MerR family transcriptional regulator, copper efflux regulator